MKTIVCVDNRMGICFNGRRVSRDRMVSWDILEMTRGNVLWMAPEADKLFKEVFKAKEEVCRETGTGKKIQDAGRLEDEKMWKVDRDFLEKAEEEDFCFVERENLAGYEGKITEIVLYKWNRDYPADVFFEVDLSKWRLEERKDFSGYSHEKITKEFYNRQGLL
ncbi:ribonuclease Z [Coprococcus comes]|uniref:ribonuclease Z n=1 Tax=Coprococcus comes TaxID=410072 RepID=UPI00319D996F